MKINLPFTFFLTFVTISAFLTVIKGAPQASADEVHQENQPCVNASDCNDEYEAYTCDINTKKCVCYTDMTYVKDLNTYTCLLMADYLEDECVYDEQCENIYDSDCLDGSCLCKKGYYYTIDYNRCDLGMVDFGDPCEIDDQCPSGAFCGSDGTCHCPVRQYAHKGSYGLSDSGCYQIWYIGTKTGLISGIAFIIIVLAAIIGYFGYQRIEKEQIEKQEFQASVSGIKPTNTTNYSSGKKDLDSKRLL